LYFTGASLTVVELAPDSRRGEALSFYSVSVYLGAGTGPVLGEWFHGHGSMPWGFATAGVIGLSSGLISLRSVETRQPSHLDDHSRRGARVSSLALVPGAVLALGMIGSTAFGAYMPLYSDELGMGGSQWVFLAYAVTVISVRIVGARLPDQLGASRSGTVAMLVIASGMGLITVIGTPAGLYAGSVVFAVGISFLYPSLMALVVSRASASERSSAVATFTSFFDVSTGFGGLSIGGVAAAGGYRSTFATAAVAAIVGLVVLRGIVLRSPAPPPLAEQPP
jgi:MFS family permease